MQTFLPYPDFGASARCLDRQRLGKQRLEAQTILQALWGQTTGWKRHPATLMWAGHESALALYGYTICLEWMDRGYRDSLASWFYLTLAEAEFDCPAPWWLGWEEFHSSHRAALLAKSYEHYNQFGWTESPIISYVWPTKEVA